MCRITNRANGKEEMARPRYQDGSLFIRGKRIKAWVARWREDVIREDGTLQRRQRTIVSAQSTKSRGVRPACFFRSECLKLTKAGTAPGR